MDRLALAVSGFWGIFCANDKMRLEAGMKESLENPGTLGHDEDKSNSTRPDSGGVGRIPWGWICSGAVGVLVLAAVIYVGPIEILRHFVMRLTEDTKYAPGYSERAFQQIAVGDSEASVRTALGAPLLEGKAEPYIRWLYAPDSSPAFEVSGSYPDFRYSFTAVTFGEDATFVDAFGQISHGSSKGLFGVSGSGSFGDGMNTLGLTQAQIDKLKAEKATMKEIEAKYGKPSATYTSRVARWLQYSTSPGSKNYRQRAIGIDREGKVCQKQSEFWWD